MMPGDNGEGDTVADAPETTAAAGAAADAVAGEPPLTTEEQEQAVHAAYDTHAIAHKIRLASEGKH